MIKVSVVVPTFRTPHDALARLVASLDAQSMSRDEFEVLFVDDGSPDDTLTRLRSIAAERENVHVHAMENSGWPSRPRNEGIARAAGEYIAFMDHDDTLYPDALRGAYEFAVRHGSDVVNGKESRTTDPGWALDVYVDDIGQAKGATGRHPLMPMNPHKLYRRSFLLQHEIRFPEGGRVLWEDIFFNVQVARHAQVISTLSSVPYYHWVTTAGSGSTTFLKSRHEYWEWLEKVCRYIASELPGEEFREQREQLLLHQYSYRVLGVFDNKYLRRPRADQRFIFERCRRLQRELGLTSLDDRLSRTRRLRAALLAEGRLDLLRRACLEDARVSTSARLQAVDWSPRSLRVTATTRTGGTDIRGPQLVSAGDRVGLRFSPQLRRAVDVSALDVTSELRDMTQTIVVRERKSRLAWSIPGSLSTHLDAEGETVALGSDVTADVDPDDVAFGVMLPRRQPIDLYVRTHVGGGATVTAVQADGQAHLRVGDGRVDLLYSNNSGNATLILDAPREALRRAEPADVRLADGAVEVTLKGHHGGGGEASVVVGRIRDDGQVLDAPARLVIEEGQALLRVRVDGDVTPIRLRVGDRAPGGAQWWGVDMSDSGVTLVRGPSPEPVPAPRKSVDSTKRLRRQVGRVLRTVGWRR